MISRALANEPLPVYGNGLNVRDWLYVEDHCKAIDLIMRKGHDLRYGIDPTKIHKELGWLPETKFTDGIVKTINWYLENKGWWENIVNGEYLEYYEKMYGEKLKSTNR